uniref:CD302 molecule n=1 Tax=Nothobranchius furzeri TaxID=105023 RepID=A0A8C6VY41_NOTFU
MEPRKKSPRSLFVTSCVFLLCVGSQRVSAGDCPADGRTWVPNGDKCYHFVHGEEDYVKSYTFERARSLCRGFELLTIQSAEDNDFVIKYSREVWKGVVVMWMGMYYDTNSDTMRWLNENPVTYTNWESTGLSDLLPTETCVALQGNTGKWENVSCSDDVENGVVCEAAQKAETPRQRKSTFELFAIVCLSIPLLCDLALGPSLHCFLFSTEPNALISALVILSVVAIMGVSAVIWFLHQRHNLGSSVFTAFEYHPPFRVLENDQSCLVEAEETNSVP